MKIIKIILFSLLALSLIACTGIFIFFQTFDTDQYLPQITKKASIALGRPVSIGHVGLGLSARGMTMDAGPVTVADDVGFTTQPFIKVDRVRISLDLGSLILHREIHITDILLQSPQVHFIRSLEGNINARSIGQANRSAVDNTVKSGIDGNSSGEGGEVVVPATPDISLKEHALFSAIDVKSIKIQDASISFIDQNQTFPLDIWLTDIDATVNDFSLSKPFRTSFNACFYSNTPNLHASILVFFDLLKRSIQISDFGLNADFSRLDIGRFKSISPEMPDNSILQNMAGIMQLNMAHVDIGSSGQLAANGKISITGGVIKNFNIIKTVLSHTPVVFGGVDGIVDKLGGVDTIIEKAQAQFSLHDKTVLIDDSLIQTNIFELTAQGSVDQGLNMDMQTMLHLNNDISAALVNELKGLKYLCDDSDRITIGASLKGVIPHLKYKPNKDFRKKSKKMFIEEGGNILGALLGGGRT